jgi:hypothetical protein
MGADLEFEDFDPELCFNLARNWLTAQVEHLRLCQELMQASAHCQKSSASLSESHSRMLGELNQYLWNYCPSKWRH